MLDPRIRDMLHALDPSRGEQLWYGGATLLGALRGVRAREAQWTPPGLRNSIWRLVLHCAHAEYLVWRKFEGSTVRGGFPRAGGDWPTLPTVLSEPAWAEDRTLLREQHQSLIEVVEHFDPARLDELAPDSSRWTHADLLLGVVMHNTHHAGQIQLLKRLWAQQGETA
jgi:uncharacterized damage-inducible protein DinB